jgi:hypothetical protein
VVVGSNIVIWPLFIANVFAVYEAQAKNNLTMGFITNVLIFAVEYAVYCTLCFVVMMAMVPIAVKMAQSLSYLH